LKNPISVLPDARAAGAPMGVVPDDVATLDHDPLQVLPGVPFVNE
jgi:hypothetical protein